MTNRCDDSVAKLTMNKILILYMFGFSSSSSSCVYRQAVFAWVLLWVNLVNFIGQWSELKSATQVWFLVTHFHFPVWAVDVSNIMSCE